jgi:hypothetical protein
MKTHDYITVSLNRSQRCKSGFLHKIWVLTVFLLAGLPLVSLSNEPSQPSATDFPFQITIDSGNETFKLYGEAEIMITPSSYAINMIEDNGRCVIHMLNFTTAPGPGTYNVEDDAKVRTAMVCLLEGVEPRERLASHSGTFTITELNNIHIKGHFDMILKGPISGKDFHFSGEVTADMVPLNLQFRP